MSERTYRSVGDPARLGAAERDPATGRRTADRSDKGEHGPGGRRRRPLVVAAVVAVLLALAGGAALAVSGGSDDEQESSGRSTTTTRAADEAPGGTGDAGGSDPGGASPLDGSYRVSGEVVEGFSYSVNSGGAGGPIDVSGSTSDGLVMISCADGSCVVDAIGGLFPSFRGDLDGSTITGELRRPFGSDPSCAPQEAVTSVEVTIGADGALAGELIEDVVPGEVACGGGVFASGTRYVTRLEGEREP